MNLFPPLPPETRRLLDGVPALIDKTFPLPGRFRSALPADVAELSRLLTSGKGERGLSYLGRPNLLSAYLRYFLPWNLYRLCRLLPTLDIPLAAGSLVVDVGSGPLTFTAALWFCRPDLRELPLEFRCIDLSGPALEAGKTFFAALAGSNCPWKIKTVKAGIDNRGGSRRRGKQAAAENAQEKPAALVCAVNVLNEMYSGISQFDATGLRLAAGNAAALLEGLAGETARILAVEPGIPQSGEFISCLRGSLIEANRFPLAPCPHCGVCPFPGGKGGGGKAHGKSRWCHFAFDTADAPMPLHKLSQAAGIPKERAVLSFLFAAAVREAKAAAPQAGVQPLRIISDAFPLPMNRMGRYACSGQGLVLAVGNSGVIRNAASGALVNAAVAGNGQRDPKSGALIVEI